VIAGRDAGSGGLGGVPAFPPPDFSQMTSVGGHSDVDRKRVSFRIVGERLDPKALTTLTGVEPDLAYRRGDLRIARPAGGLYGPWRTGMWLLGAEAHVAEAGTKLEEHLVHLLDRLRPHAAELAELIRRERLAADFSCGYFQQQVNSGWVISAATLG